MSKKILYVLVIPLVIYANFSNQTNTLVNNFSQRTVWDTMIIYSGSTTLRRVAIANHIKGPEDDTMRIFTVQSAAPRNVLLLTDISASPPMIWRTDILETPSANSMQVGVGDVDRDSTNDLIYAQSGTPYHLKRAYWNDSTWAFEVITTMNGASWGMDVGDADNDGYNDDIIYASGVTSNCQLNWAHFNGTTWETSIICNSDGSTIQSVAINDCDSALAGNEVIAVTGGSPTGTGRVLRCYFNGASWDTMTLWRAADNASLTAVAIGDFDASHYGNEIAVGNGLGPGSMTRGAVIEVFGEGSSWQARPIFTPDTSENCWGLAIGDFLSTNPGDEIIKSGSFSYYVRAIWGSGDNWYNEIIFEIPGSSYGAAVGDVNKYRTDNDEIVVTGNYKVIEVEEHIQSGIEYPITNNIINHTLEIMPNPSREKVFVNYSLPSARAVEVKLFNVFGKLIYLAQRPPQTKHLITIDTKSLLSGVYVLHLKSDNCLETRKLLITR